MTRPTHHIGAKAAQTNYYAAEQAARIGFPLNYHATINFASTTVDPRQAVKCFGELRRARFNKWATRPRKGAGPAVPPTYVFAFENARDGRAFKTMGPGEAHNVHVHWSLHIPPSRLHDFKSALWEWVEELTGGIIGGEETIMVKPLTTTPSYLLKGATPAVVKMYGRGQQAEPQGIIYGRRADTSRNIGPTARRQLDRERGINRRRSYLPVPAAGIDRASAW